MLGWVGGLEISGPLLAVTKSGDDRCQAIGRVVGNKGGRGEGP